MNQDLHPEYSEVNAKFSCGVVLAINSVRKEDISIGVCSRFHQSYTEKQKTIDSGGRVGRYKKRLDSRAKTTEKDGS